MTETTLTNRVYVDANPFIYALEGPEEQARQLIELFTIFRAMPGLALTSELTLAEVLPKREVPDRKYLDLLVWSRVVSLLPVTRDILIDTSKYRRVTKIQRDDGSLTMPKLPDAIHVVTAAQNRCEIFLSSDTKIKLPDTMHLIRADKAGVASLLQKFK